MCHPGAINSFDRMEDNHLENSPANMILSPKAGSMLGQRRRQWPDVEAALGEAALCLLALHLLEMLIDSSVVSVYFTSKTILPFSLHSSANENSNTITVI